jgi:glycosyltransferase involved in cell wall biosynthesis
MFTVVFIVRDEERHLPGALESLGTIAELVVCDTGSRDATVEVAREAGARVVHHAWRNDFAAARAFAESHATQEWIVRFDADERFASMGAPGLSFREWLVPQLVAAEEVDAGQVFVRRRYAPGNEHWFPRVHRRGRYRWRHPVHELLQPLEGTWPPAMAAAGAVILHERALRPRPYRQILEAAVVEAPADPHLLFHLGQACFEEQDLAATDFWLRRYLAGPAGYRFHRSEAWMLLGRCLAARGDSHEAFHAFEQASLLGPRAEPLWHAAHLALGLGDMGRARACMERGRALPPPRERQPFGLDDHPYLLDLRLYQAATWDALAGEIASRGRSG